MSSTEEVRIVEMTTMDAATLAKCFLAGAKELEAHRDLINELNVFPVPDGDTGTNMTMTIMSAAKEVSSLEKPDMRSVCKAMSSGSLRGARGNSGVILSQLFRGFTKVVKHEDEITVDLLAEAFQKSCETAFKAVMKPKEGTILTVARAAADKAQEVSEYTDDILEFSSEVLKEAEAVLNETPEMLPVLKQAGVVDSGGKGLVEVLSGADMFLSGKEMDLSIEEEPKQEETAEQKEDQIRYIYQTNFKISLMHPAGDHEIADLESYLSAIGEGAYLTSTPEEIAVTLTTNDPGHVLTKALKYGDLTDVDVINLKAQKKKASSDSTSSKPSVSYEQAYAQEPKQPRKAAGFVAVAVGEGLAEIFRGLGVDEVIEGGQTMNPSTDDILNAVSKVNADAVFLLPNNKNIILAANQAAILCEDKTLVVIPTKTIPQGISAMINYIETDSAEENEKHMNEALSAVSSGEITYAVRDTMIDDKKIHKGDYMGIGDAGIIAVHPDIRETFLAMLDQMTTEDSSLLSLYFGSDVTEKDAKALADAASEKFPSLEIEVSNGGQPVYYYILSVE